MLLKVPKLLIKYLRGTSSNEEVKDLNSWLDKDTRHKTLLNDLQDEEKLSSELNQYNNYDVSKAWNAFELKTQASAHSKHYLLPIIKVAAVIVLMVSLGGVLYFSVFNSNPTTIASNSLIEAGLNNAIIQIGDNNAIRLTDSLNTVVSTKNTMLAKIENGQIDYASIQGSSVKIELVVPEQCEYNFTLSDGSNIWLNAGSKVSFEHPFKGDYRTINAEGEIFLSVAKDPDHPFIVNLPQQNGIKVLGTEFNVKAYADDDKIETVLVEGSILWQTSNGKERILEPGQLLELTKKSMEISVKDVDVYPHIAWTQGQFVFESERLEDIITSLSRWYGVTVLYEDNDLKDLHFSVDVKRYDNLNEILSMLELTEKVYFKINGSEILVRKN